MLTYHHLHVDDEKNPFDKHLNDYLNVSETECNSSSVNLSSRQFSPLLSLLNTIMASKRALLYTDPEQAHASRSALVQPLHFFLLMPVTCCNLSGNLASFQISGGREGSKSNGKSQLI